MSGAIAKLGWISQLCLDWGCHLSWLVLVGCQCARWRKGQIFLPLQTSSLSLRIMTWIVAGFTELCRHDSLSAKCQFATKGGMVGKKTRLFSTAFQLCHAFCVCMHIGNSSNTFSDVTSWVAPQGFYGRHCTSTSFDRNCQGERKWLTGPQGRGEPSCPNHSELHLHRVLQL